jgi:hypothetical protein
VKIDVFCSWGEGSDVGINIHRTIEEVAAFPAGFLVPLDLTSEEARILAGKLLMCADRADELEHELEQYMSRTPGDGYCECGLRLDEEHSHG